MIAPVSKHNWRCWQLAFCLLLIIYIFIGITTALTIEETADIIHKNSDDDWTFVKNVDDYVNYYIKYKYTGTLAVKSPELAWQDRIGDCSELSQVKAKMLTKHGVDAKVVSGYVPGYGYHSTVEVHADHYWKYIDAKDYPGFVKQCDGILPGEYMVGL